MKKSAQIGIIVLIIVLVGAGIGIGVYFVMNQPPSQEEDVVLTIKGSGTTNDFTLTMSELKSSKYRQFTNLFYARSIDRNATYSGVSIRDILEKESLLTGDALNFTFIAADGYDSAVAAGYFFNINDLINADYDECIFAYGGTDFIPEVDGLIRSIVNITVFPDENLGKFWNKNCTEMQIIAGVEPEDVVMTIWGSGTTSALSLTMSDLQSSEYQQFTNQFYARSIDRNGTYSGVSIRDILEKESLLNGGAVNYTFIAADGYNSAVAAGGYFNITKLMNAGYAECIFAYGGTDFDPESDGLVRSIINMTVNPDPNLGKFWNRNCTEMQIIGEPFITFDGSGTTGSISLTMTQLTSSKYQQFTNQFYARSIDRNGTYSGVSIRDILEKESLLTGGAVNYTFIAADGYNSVEHAEGYLNITKLMNAGYAECIFAYGGTDFDPLDDGPFRSIINMTVQSDINLGPYWNRNCIEMLILV